MSTIMTRSAALFWWGKDKVPDDVAYFYYSGGVNLGCKINWQMVTFNEIRKRKIEKQECHLEWKRRIDSNIIVPGYVWVFFNPHFPFSGWWVYVKTFRKDFAMNFRGEQNPHIMNTIYEMFPCGVIKGFEEDWCESFCKYYSHRGFGRTKKQGLAKIKCVIKNDKLIEISGLD